MSQVLHNTGPDSAHDVPGGAEPRLRLWPGVLLIAVLWSLRLAGSWVAGTPGTYFFFYMIAPLAITVLVALWWLALSRIPLGDRLLGLGMFLAGGAATMAISPKTFPTMALILYALPLVVTIWVGWLLVSMPLSWPTRRRGLIVALVLAWIPFNLLRVDGMTGSFAAKFTPRWQPTAEDRLLSSLASASHSAKPADGAPAAETATPAETIALAAGDWPGFRGAARDGRLCGVEIATDWKTSPPRELWRHLIGPGWSSFAVIGHRAYTQEQRGDDELVVCYDLDTGAELWAHHDATRFNELVAGPGPRGTPTFDDGRIFALGANGMLNCLDAASGKVQWSADIVKDSAAKIPQWGFSSSPQVAQGVVAVFAGGPEGKSVLGYKADTGELAWSAGEGTLSYCSPELARLDGVEQLLISTDAGLTSIKPDSGEVLWKHSWPSESIARIIQPAVLGDSDVLIGTGMGIGTRRIHVGSAADAWPIDELWTSKSIKPYYNDLVIDGDQLYGFDGNIFMCVDLADGKVRWKKRGYGNGQVLLLADEHLLVVLTEEGEVVLVEAKPEMNHEIASFKALEGKTWNHPVIAHGKLLVRNGEEVACFELAPAAGSAGSPAVSLVEPRLEATGLR